MQSLFLPAIALMNRLRYTQKFAFMGILMLVAVGVVLNNLYSALDSNIRSSSAELRGIKTIKPAQQIVQYMQQHRGMSAGVIAGNEAMKEKRVGKEKDVSAAIKAAETKMSPDLLASKEWKAIVDGWAQIGADGLNWTSTENFTRHTALIDKIITFMVDVADDTSLTVDPDIDSYYLIDTVLNKAPVVLERLGQMRAKGTGVLTKKQMYDQQKIEMSSLMAELNSAQKILRINLEKTARFNPGMKAALDSAAKEFSESAERINALVVDDMLLGTFATTPKDYFELTTVAIDKGTRRCTTSCCRRSIS